MKQTKANKVWFVTGASRGFGAEVAQAALKRGDFVVATARNPQTVAAALGDHPNLLAVKLDVTREADAAAAAKLATDRFGRIDVLVNNAGYGLLGAVEEASAEEVKAQFDTNVFGLLNVTRAVLPVMRKQGGGHVINISSVGGYVSYPGWGIYCATKFAVEALSESLSQELAPLGIRSTVVEPGFFRTDFLQTNSMVNTQARIDAYAATVGEMRNLMADVNQKQPGDPKKFAQAMLTLADSANPPQRLAVGTDTVKLVREKNAFVESELKQWMAVSVSTNHDDVKLAA